MTGEMAWINQDGEDSNGECWATHAAVAQALSGELHPFDAYQGPYITIGPDVTTGAAPYAMPVRHLGIIRLWLVTEDGEVGRVWREDTDTPSDEFLCEDTASAIEAAQSLLAA